MSDHGTRLVSRVEPRGWLGSVRRQMVAVFSAVFLTVLAALLAADHLGVPFTSMTGRLDQDRAEALRAVDLAADQRKERIRQLLVERAQDIEAFFGNESTRSSVAGLAATVQKAEASGRHGEDLWKVVRQDLSYAILASNVGNLARMYPSVYHRIQIADARTLRVWVSTDARNVGRPLADHLGLDIAVPSGNARITDISLCPVVGAPALHTVYDIRASDDATHVLATVVMELTVDELFTSVERGTIGLGRTGEALMVNDRSFFLTIPRFPLSGGGRVQPLVTPNTGTPAVLAARGGEGRLETEDYRGERVIAAYRHIRLGPAWGWGLVVKQDASETFANAYRGLRSSLILALVGLVGLVGLTVAVASSLTGSLRRISATVARLASGDRSARTGVTRRDDLGLLAGAFDQMADTNDATWRQLEQRADDLAQTTAALAGRERAQQHALAISSSLAAAATLDDLLKRSLDDLMRTTRSQVGAVYLAPTQPPHTLLLAHATGVAPEHRLPAEIRVGEGLMGLAAGRTTIDVVSGLPADTAFLVHTVAGDAVPNTLVHLPLTMGDALVGVVALASVFPFEEDCRQVLEMAAPQLATAIANALSHRATERMAQTLRDTNSELQAVNEELQAQSEELRQQAKELEIQRLRVNDASRLKSEFLSNMSHELRTPLNSIMALSQLMMARGPSGGGGDKDLEYLPVIERNGRQLLGLINDILDLSKIESGRMQIEVTAFDPTLLAQEVLDVVRPMAREKALDLVVSGASPRQMHSDPERLRQILLNLLSNAVKFTDAGSVRLDVTVRGSGLVFAVADTGIGIPAEAFDHIFDEFRQVDGTSTRRHAGTGLGLAISRRLAVLLGGRLAVESEVGRGSVFTLTLPVTCPATAPVAAIAAGPARAAIVTPAVSPRRVLVVDDDEATRELLRAYLTEIGYEVTTAAGGREAVSIATELRPFAITLDLLMDGQDGWETLRALKARAQTASIPVVIVSVTDDRATGVALGASGYVVKPVEKTLLLAELDRVALTRLIGRALVVDDSPIDRERISAIVGERCQHVQAAASGEEAIALAASDPPDVVILDIVMPGLDGFAVLDRLRAMPATANLPVIVLTAKDLTQAEQDRLAAGTRRVIGKSGTSRADLLREIEVLLERLARERQPAERGHILVVEDNDVAALQIRTALEEQGYLVTRAPGGSAAMATLATLVPDLIVLDLMMPEVDGFQVLDQVRNVPRTASVPVLVLTAQELTPADLARLRFNQVEELIQKGSLDRAAVVGRVARLLEQRCHVPSTHTAERSQTVLGPSVAAAEPRGTMVLVVEDNPDNTLTVTEILTGLGLPFACAADGEEAVRLARTARPALILMDMLLPGMSGLEATRQIKADPALSAIPIVALTARAMKGDREEILAAGCDDYLAKPFTPEQLKARLLTWLPVARS
jgi:CheY-like chemotaxis protein/signal transduction histidine kinase/HAMP domain-containing protein